MCHAPARLLCVLCSALPLQLGGMLDEASLERFESQSHLLDPDSLAALQVRLAAHAAAGLSSSCC